MIPADLSPLYISIKTALAATLISFSTGLYAGWLMASFRGRSKGIIDGFMTLPLVLPPTVLGFFLLLLVGKRGPIGYLLGQWEISLIFTWEATVIAAAVVSFPLMYKAARAAFEQLDPELIYAARSLGLPEWKVFFRISVPLAWPGIAAGTVLAFARALGEFGATLMVAGNIPGKTQTIPLAIFFASESGNMDQAAMWVIMVLILSITVIALLNYWTSSQYQQKHPGAIRESKIWQ